MAVSHPQTPTVEDAQAIAGRIIASFPSVDAVILCGSVARGDAGEWSDIDLVVIAAAPEITVERLRKLLSRRKERVSTIFYQTSAFLALLREGGLFVAHLRKEGIVLFDRLNLRQTLANPSPTPTSDIAEQVRAQRAKLASYADPRRFNNNFLFCLSHLYSIGKGIVMLGLAKRGVLEFNREAAFQRFAALNPDLAAETQKVAQLRPFYRLVVGREPEPLPFSYRSADREMKEAVRAIHTIAERAEGL